MVIRMKFDKYEKELIGDEKDKIINAVKKCFFYKNKNDISVLWNTFVQKPRCIPFEEIVTLDIPKKNLYFYLERENQLFVTSLKEIIEFVDSFEPWDEVDAYIFCESKDWIVAITHEDNLLLCLGV